VPGQHDFGSHTRKPRGQDRWPDIATVVAVYHLDLLSANPPGGLEDESGFQQTQTADRQKGQFQLANNSCEGRADRTCEPHGLAGALQPLHQLEALIIRSPTREGGIQVQHAGGPRAGWKVVVAHFEAGWC